jgi:hypothetical protein
MQGSTLTRLKLSLIGFDRLAFLLRHPPGRRDVGPIAILTPTRLGVTYQVP